MSSLEAEIEALCATGALEQAARRWAQAGEHLRASRLYERACMFAEASVAALEGDEPAEAMRLAVSSGEAALVRRAAVSVVRDLDAEGVRRLAADLCSQGHHRSGADLHRRSGDFLAAAEAFERAGAASEAAACFDAAGKPAQAARILEAALRAGGLEDVDALRVELGRLYGRHGKHEAAVRVLQQLAPQSERRREGLVALARSLEALGLSQGLRDLGAELAERAITRAEIEGTTEVAEGRDELIFGRYRIEREVANTPHARLVLAFDEVAGEQVAVKIFAARAKGTGRDALARFGREAQALAKLRHPNVVPLRGYFPDGPAMVLSWMSGGSLRDLLDRESVSPARAAEITRGLLDALAEAHRLGILHRDIKPSNLLFDGGGTARVADFGAAHLAASEATVTAGAIGTAGYMAPEQRAGQAASVVSDLYGVGVVFYEMLTGALPARESRAAVSAAHPDLTEAHDRLFDRLLAGEPGDRFASAIEARRAVEGLSWPTRRVARALPRVLHEPALEEVADDRLEPAHRAGDAHDRWLRRDIFRVPLDELARVAPFARADHPALATVLRVDEASVWVEAPRGRPLAQGLALSAAQRDALEAGLTALHRSGGVHGCVDADHVYLLGSAAVLAFPREPRSGASPDGDLAALAALP